MLMWGFLAVFGGISAACFLWCHWMGLFDFITDNDICEFAIRMGWKVPNGFVGYVHSNSVSIYVEVDSKRLLLEFSRLRIKPDDNNPVRISRKTQKLWRAYQKEVLKVRKEEEEIVL